MLTGALFNRERLAGYDPDILEKGSVVIVGCGAAANNIALNLALSGVGEIRCIDFDEIEPSNLTRSPLFRPGQPGTNRPRYKARELALGFLSNSYAGDPTARYAVARFEKLGLGALAGAGVVISAVDSFTVRARLADAARLLGIPAMVEIGFRGHRGQVSVFSNRSPEAPCWRCLHPDVSTGGVSCLTYARAVVADGRTPATQAVASILGGVAAEAAIQALHGSLPLDARVFHLDIRTGRSDVVGVSADQDCPGVHRCLGPVRRLDVRADEPLAHVFELLGERYANPIVHLPGPFLMEAPCGRCGARVRLGKPEYDVREPPTCTVCPETPPRRAAALVAASLVDATSRLARTRCRKLGLPAGAIFEVEDAATGTVEAVQLAGGPDDIFITKRRPPRNGTGTQRMDSTDAVAATATED